MGFTRNKFWSTSLGVSIITLLYCNADNVPQVASCFWNNKVVLLTQNCHNLRNPFDSVQLYVLAGDLVCDIHTYIILINILKSPRRQCWTWMAQCFHSHDQFGGHRRCSLSAVRLTSSSQYWIHQFHSLIQTIQCHTRRLPKPRNSFLSSSPFLPASSVEQLSISLLLGYSIFNKLTPQHQINL